MGSSPPFPELASRYSLDDNIVRVQRHIVPHALDVCTHALVARLPIRHLVVPAAIPGPTLGAVGESLAAFLLYVGTIHMLALMQYAGSQKRLALVQMLIL